MKIISARIIAATISLGSVLAMSACNRQETPSETQEDVAKAQREGNQDVAEEAANAATVAAKNREDIVGADDAAEVREASSDAMKEFSRSWTSSLADSLAISPETLALARAAQPAASDG